ncbi:MAG: asparagine synthase [Rhodothermaceae bacterium]|nr:asparagine synthase [Rhodothermaceae bacterium]
MAGLFGLIRPGKPAHQPMPLMFAAGFPGNDVRSHEHMNITCGLAAEPSFRDERVLETRDDVTVGFYGFLFQPASERADMLFERYRAEGHNFVFNLEGFFSGFIHDASKKKLYLFTDHLSTRPLYYGCDHKTGHLAFSGDAHHAAALLRGTGTALTLNSEALTCLLVIGYLYDDQTPVHQIRKILPGTLLEIDLNDFSVTRSNYFAYQKHPVPERLADCLQHIDSLLMKSVQKIWDKDIEHGYGHPHTALLSGGLDSRVNVMLASETGYKPVKTYTLSQTGSRDEIIAKRVSDSCDFQSTYIALDSGTFLYDNIKTYIAANDGLVTYNGAAHLYSSVVPEIGKDNGILHTGQIGDLVFGSLTLRNPSIREKILKKGYLDEPHLVMPLDVYNRIADRYSTANNFERFGYDQHVVNGALNSDRMMHNHVETLSPFYDRKLIEFCYSLPDRLKFDQAIYIKWMNRYHPRIAGFPWAKTGIRPRNILITRAAGFLQKVNRHASKRFGLKYDDMNPFDLWYRDNPELKMRLMAEYNSHVHRITDAGLREALDYCIRKDKAQYLMNAVTVVLSVDLYTNQQEPAVFRQ